MENFTDRPGLIRPCLISCAIVFALFVVPAIMTVKIRYVPDNFQPSSDVPRKVFVKTSLAQRFLSEESNLSAIGASIKNPNLQNRKGIMLNLYSDEGILIRNVELSGSNIGDGDFVKFVFAPLGDSEGKIYTVEFTAQGSFPHDALEIFTSSAPPAWLYDMSYGSEVIQGSGIALVRFHTPRGMWEVAREIYSGALGRLLKDAYFAFFYAVLVFGALGYLVFSRPKHQV